MTERAKKLLLLYYKQGRKIRRVSGLPPLTFKAKKAGTLNNYRIYGDTVDGESVGDRTGNLFDGELAQGYWAAADGSYVANYPTWICTNKLPCKPNTTYTLSFNSANSRWYGFFWYTENGDYILSDMVKSPQTQCHYTASAPSNAAYMAIDIAGYPDIQDRIKPSDVTDLMLVEGSAALPYEPYGYKVPVTVSNGTDTLTTPIYLPEPIKMVGDEAEYVDYGEQKMHRVRTNILPMSTTPIDTIIDDFHCEYDGMGIIKLTALTDNAVLSGFTVPLSKDFTIPVSIGQGGTGCIQFNNDAAYKNANNAASFCLNFKNNTRTRDSWTLNVINKISATYIAIGGANINSIQILTTTDAATNVQSGQTLTISPAFVENVTAQIPFEPYIENTDLDVTLPALPVLPGTNVLSVGTEVQPSSVEIKGRIKAAGGD